MKDIASYLVELQEVKEDIKSSIERKGVTVTGGLSSYSSAIDKIEQGGGSCVLEDKTISITENGTTVVNPSDGYDGLSKVDVNVDVQPNLFTFEEELTTNGEYSYSVNFPGSPYDGFGDFKIDVNVQPRLQSLIYNVNKNGEYDIIPTDNYNAIGNVKLTVDVPTTGGRIAWRNGSKLGFTKLTDILTISDKFYFDDVTDMSYLFSYSSGWMTWSNHQNPPFFNCSNATTMEQMFANMNGNGNVSIEILDSLKVANMNSMFWTAKGLNSVVIEAGSVTNMGSMFKNCDVKYINIKNTSNVTNMISMFEGCIDVKSINLIDCSSVQYIDRLFAPSSYAPIYHIYLTDLGGFKNLKVGITQYFLENCPNVTVISLMNVINNLYDLTANGLSGQTLKFGTTNLNKLTTEQIAVATNKGWTLI